jgi:predicted amidophosphoribosyltransferase
MTRTGIGHAGLQDRAAGIVLVNRWIKAIAALLGTEAGCVILSDSTMARLVSRYNIPHAFMASHITLSSAPYAPDEVVIVRDATRRADLHAFLGALALGKTGFYYRRPLRSDGGQILSLIMFGETPRPEIADRELALVAEIAGEMGNELERYYPSGATNMTASMLMTRADVESWLGKTDLPAALFDSRLVLLAVNTAMREIIPINWDATIGRPLDSLDLPARGSIEFLFRHAIATSTSTPRMDLVLQDSAGEGLPHMMRLVGAPVSPTDGEPLLIATIDPARMAPAPPLPIGISGENDGQRVTSEFLLETLVQRRALRSRKDVSYVTLRSWRQPIRTHQIRALKAIKRNAPQTIASEIAAEMRDDIMSLFGAGNFRAVVPMPCGHSAAGRCLSVAIAQALARELGLPVAHALSLPAERGSSHPKTNAKRAPMSLTSKVEGPVLLIDDVATSGRHVEEATKLLRSTGASVLAIVWIGGDGDTDDTEGE